MKSRQSRRRRRHKRRIGSPLEVMSQDLEIGFEVELSIGRAVSDWN